ncbi:MAG: hypothetical protein ACYSTT_21555 [Planctomycetota bacterium]|jgi:hypothetical protein
MSIKPKRTHCCRSFQILIALIAPLLLMSRLNAMEPKSVTFQGRISEHKWPLKELDSNLPADWTGYKYLVLELRASTPQRFALWLYTADGPRRIMLHPFGQNVWLRASIPLRFFKGRDQSGHDMASANNRRSEAFWMSVWGPFGSIDKVQAMGVTMAYPINQPKLDIRSIRLTTEEVGSDFLEKKPVLDEFGQWAHADWPGKIKSKKQLTEELADEAKILTDGNPFKTCEYGGYLNTKAKATGFFRVEQIDGIWWFVDPHGHLFLSTGSNCIRGRGRRGATVDTNLIEHRMTAWGLNTVGNWSSFRESEDGRRKAYVATFRSPRTQPLFLGMPDVYGKEFARRLDEAAQRQCERLKDDPWLIGTFIGNEPPWPGRESELVSMFLSGPDTVTKTKLKAYLAQGDTKERREKFIHTMFERYLDLINAAIKKYDSNHLNLGIRFGGSPPEAVCRMASKFDVCSINVYEYEPTRKLKRTFALAGRPIVIGEFHFGVPANGLSAGLVQTLNQSERAAGYRYYVEQAIALPYFLGAHWFQWQDQPVLGRGDGENYNIGLVSVTNRPYPELVQALKATHKVLYEVHTGKVKPFSRRPLASEAGTPNSPWD